MPSILPGYEYDIFISYRHNDNKGDRWVSGFLDALKSELDSTFKEKISVYLDTNIHDGLSDHHDVDLSLKGKVKALIMIPIISQTYCDPTSFAWKNEFLPFLDLASRDSFGLKVKVASGNVASRVLPIRIHELDEADLRLLEKELGGVLRAIDFTFRTDGINRPLKASDKNDAHKISFSDQLNKVAHAVKEILDALKSGSSRPVPLSGELFLGSDVIPSPATALFGRSRELDELRGLLNHNRLISIIGTGGMGKTRLVLELAHRAREVFAGNVAVAFLASVTSTEEVIPAIANLLGIKEAERRDLTKTIASVIGDRRALLVLDNMEHVAGVAPQIAKLILSCPNLTILTTSRMPLRITAEYEYPLQPLPLPSVENLMSAEQAMEFPSISLFTDRAKKVKRTFELSNENARDVARICARLDGLPLALELAAARIRIMSVSQLLQRLEHALDILTTGPKDLPERHQTLRATVNWSHSILNENEKRLFRRMSVFSGGCIMEAIEYTCYEENSSSSSLIELESLVDKGLVQPPGPSGRFMMLETLRQFAAEKLNEAGETIETRTRHAEYLVKVTRSIREGLEGLGQLDAMQQGIDEEQNIHTALDFLLEEGRKGRTSAVEMGLKICGHLYFFWHIRCKHIMARHYSNSFLGAPNCPDSGAARALCLNTTAIASFTLGNHEQCVKEYHAAYVTASTIEDRLAMVFALLGMFLAEIGLGRMNEANRLQKENMALALNAGSDFFLAFAYWAEGLIHLLNGGLDTAVVDCERALAIQQKNSDFEGSGITLSTLAMAASLRGNYDTSIELYQKSLSSFITIGDRAEQARALDEMAWVFLKTENWKAARQHFIKSIRAYEDVGSVRGMGIALMGIAGVESLEGNSAKAIRIATAAQLFTDQEGIVNSYGEGFQGKVYLDSARGKLSTAELEKEMAMGRALSLKETLQLAGKS